MMQLTDPAGMTLRGDLEERLRRAYRHLIDLDTEEMWRELDAPDEVWHWGADYPGRWIATMAFLKLLLHEEYDVATAANRLIGYQQPNGGFGDYSSPYDYKEWFGMGRGLVGLLEYHVATGHPAALEAGRRLGDYYVENYPAYEPYMYECYSNALEGLVLLAQLTGDQRYATTACQMAETSMVFGRVWQSTSLGPNGRRSPCGGQVHCQLMAARGLLDLHELTGETKYLTPVLGLHEYISQNTLSIAGGVGFYFNRPEENEACADADWLRLNLQLWRLSGEVRYLDLAERTLVNQIPFAQAANGAFCYMRGLQNRSGAAFDVCCSHHAPRALWEVMRYAFTTGPDLLSVNLFVDATAVLGVSDQEITLSSQPSVENETFVLDIDLGMPSPASFAVRVRVPEWVGEADLFVNGERVTHADHPGFAVIERRWSAGDRFTARFPHRVRIVRGHRLGEHVLHADEAAVLLGPKVFCLSDLHNPAVEQHLVRLRLGDNSDHEIAVAGPDRLKATGIAPDGTVQMLTMTPITNTSGNPNGIGRSHPALASPFRVWFPVEESGNGG
jgi:DUF1680 family protein